MIEQILEWYGAISAISTVAFLIWGWAHNREVAIIRGGGGSNLDSPNSARIAQSN